MASCASTVSTSHGLVTMTKTASGEASSSCGIIDFRMFALTPASSMRVWPGFCFAPAVITTTCDPAVTEMSAPPTMSLDPVNWAPCARSSTSASVFSAAMS